MKKKELMIFYLNFLGHNVKSNRNLLEIKLTLVIVLIGIGKAIAEEFIFIV